MARNRTKSRVRQPLAYEEGMAGLPADAIIYIPGETYKERRQRLRKLRAESRPFVLSATITIVAEELTQEEREHFQKLDEKKYKHPVKRWKKPKSKHKHKDNGVHRRVLGAVTSGGSCVHDWQQITREVPKKK